MVGHRSREGAQVRLRGCGGGCCRIQRKPFGCASSELGSSVKRCLVCCDWLMTARDVALGLLILGREHALNEKRIPIRYASELADPVR